MQIINIESKSIEFFVLFSDKVRPIEVPAIAQRRRFVFRSLLHGFMDTYRIDNACTTVPEEFDRPSPHCLCPTDLTSQYDGLVSKGHWFVIVFHCTVDVLLQFG